MLSMRTHVRGASSTLAAAGLLLLSWHCRLAVSVSAPTSVSALEGPIVATARPEINGARAKAAPMCTGARPGADPCLPHGKTDPLTGLCGDSGSQTPAPDSANPAEPACFTCYGGPNCTHFLGDKCVVEVACAWPLAFQDYWSRTPCPNGEPVTHIPSDFGQAYQFFMSDGGLLPALNASIRALHRAVGNVQTQGYYVLPGHGGTGAALSVLAALAETHGSAARPARVFAQAPYYFDYSHWPSIADPIRLRWAPNETAARGPADPTLGPVIEMLNSPANPTGERRTPLPSVNTSMLVCDYVFNWPQYKTGVEAQPQCDIMLFSLSKATGHAGSRVGWALIKERTVYEAAANYMLDQTLGVSVDAQARAVTIIRRLLQQRQAPGPGSSSAHSASDSTDDSHPSPYTPGGFFASSGRDLAARWAAVRTAMKPCAEILALDNSATEGPTAWLRSGPGTNASGLMVAAGIGGISGPRFGAGPEFYRLNMLDSASTMDLLTERLTRFCMRLRDTGTLGMGSSVQSTAAGLEWEQHLVKNRRAWRWGKRPH